MRWRYLVQVLLQLFGTKMSWWGSTFFLDERCCILQLNSFYQDKMRRSLLLQGKPVTAVPGPGWSWLINTGFGQATLSREWNIALRHSLGCPTLAHGNSWAAPSRSSLLSLTTGRAKWLRLLLRETATGVVLTLQVGSIFRKAKVEQTFTMRISGTIALLTAFNGISMTISKDSSVMWQYLTFLANTLAELDKPVFNLSINCIYCYQATNAMRCDAIARGFSKFMPRDTSFTVFFHITKWADLFRGVSDGLQGDLGHQFLWIRF